MAFQKKEFLLNSRICWIAAIVTFDMRNKHSNKSQVLQIQ